MDATSWATFWAFAALVIFLGIAVYLKVPGAIARSLDDRSAKIRKDLDEARKLREQAQALLADYEARRREAEKEAGSIVEAAKRDAETMVEDARRKTEEFIQRRTAMAETKIAQAERDAIAEVRASAVDLAVEAARSVISGQVAPKAGGDMFKSALDAIKSRMN